MKSDIKGLRDNYNWSDRTSSTVLDNPFVEGLPTKEKVDYIKNWLKEHADKYNPKYIKFYHGTHPKLPIETKGLLPTTTNRRRSYQSESGYVYLANTPCRAKTFGDLGNGINNSAVYEVIVKIQDLKPDKDQLNNQRIVGENIGNSIAESIVYGGGVRIKGKIPVWQIRKYIDKSKGVGSKNSNNNTMNDGSIFSGLKKAFMKDPIVKWLKK